MANIPKVIKGFKEETSTITYAEAIEEAGRCYLCHDAPCSKASPAGTDIAGFITRMRSRNFRGALRQLKHSNFFPGITSRVSPYDEQCEAACLKNKFGPSIRIAELERVLAEFDLKSKNHYVPDGVEEVGKTVAIVGSGPTGLSAAVELAINGFKVIIYETSRIPGGVLTKGVPGYLISDQVIDHEIGSVMQLGVDMVTGINVGENINLISLRNSYDALLLAIGMNIPKRLEVPGQNEKCDIFTGFEILESLKLKEKRLRVGDKVVIIGGGNVSLDVATSLGRLGIDDVTVLYWKDRESMPVFKNRVRMFKDSGAKLITQTVVDRVETEKSNTGIERIVCRKTEVKEDESGKMVAVPIEGSEFILEADTLIYSVGQELDRTLVDLFALECTEEGRIKVDKNTNRTTDEFVFAAGSCVQRTESVVEAIAMGKNAARNIMQALLD